MASNLNAPRWDGQPGHYEVYYVSLTDRGSGWGIWIRYTMLAPADGGQATASLWLMAMEPDGNGAPIGRKATWPADALHASAEPGDYVDGASVFVPRFGRELGPNTHFEYAQREPVPGLEVHVR